MSESESRSEVRGAELVDGHRFTRMPDPADPRFDLVTMRVASSHGLSSGTLPPVAVEQLEGEEAMNAQQLMHTGFVASFAGVVQSRPLFLACDHLIEAIPSIPPIQRLLSGTPAHPAAGESFAVSPGSVVLVNGERFQAPAGAVAARMQSDRIEWLAADGAIVCVGWMYEGGPTADEIRQTREALVDEEGS